METPARDTQPHAASESELAALQAGRGAVGDATAGAAVGGASSSHSPSLATCQSNRACSQQEHQQCTSEQVLLKERTAGGGVLEVEARLERV